MVRHAKKRINRGSEGDVNPFPCDQCTKSFGNLLGLNIHRGKMHKDGHRAKRRRGVNGETGQQDDSESTSAADALDVDMVQDQRDENEDQNAAGCSSADDDGDVAMDQDQRSHEEICCPSCGVFSSRKLLIKCFQCSCQYHITCVNMSKFWIQGKILFY